MLESAQTSPNRLRPSDLLLLAAAAAFWPLSVLGRNVVGMPHPERLLAVGVIVFVGAIGVASVLASVGLPTGPVVRTTFIGVVVLMMGGRVVVEVGVPWGYLIVAGVVVLAAVVFTKFGEHPVVSPVIVGLAVVVLGGSVLSLYAGLSELGSDGTSPPERLDVTLSHTPDIFVVVLDGYPGLKTLGTYGGHSYERTLEELDFRGFQSPESAWSAYWSTALSIPSILDMTYPAVGRFEGSATDQALYDRIGGDNELVRLAKANGYHVVMVESGWSGSSCGSRIDQCVPSPIVDEAMTLVVRDNVVGVPLMQALGSPFTVGSEHSMNWLLENGGNVSRDDTPSLVLAHLVIPHPPFYLDAGCRRVVGSDRSGSGLYEGDTPDEVRDRYFSDQMACVDQFMFDLADVVDDDAVIVFTADHGSARFRQLDYPGEEWSEAHIEERLNIFMSVRVVGGCDLGDHIILPNLMRRVLSCYAESPIDDLGPRMFIAPMVEIDGATVQKLMTKDVS